MTINYKDVVIPEKSVLNEKKRLINQTWKLIPMKEKDESWREQLYSLLEEIAGLGKIAEIGEDEKFLILLCKLRGLDTEDCHDFMLYRKTVFKCIDLISKVLSDE